MFSFDVLDGATHHGEHATHITQEGAEFLDQSLPIFVRTDNK